MRGHRFLFGSYSPGNSWLHRLPYGVKLLGMFLVGVLCVVLPAVYPPGWVAVSGLCLLLVGVGLSAKLPLRVLFASWRALLILASVTGLLLCWSYGWAEGWPRALLFAGVLFSCVCASVLLLRTTQLSEILTGITTLLQPLRFVGVNPEKLGLTIALMFRSIPELLGVAEDVRDAARARGLERSVRARLIPTVIASISLAQATGEALTARGLDDSFEVEAE